MNERNHKRWWYSAGSTLAAGIVFWMGAMAWNGIVLAVDNRIDDRVQVAIDAFQIQNIENKLEFYYVKSEFSPLTPDDKANKKALERQLKRLNTE